MFMVVVNIWALRPAKPGTGPDMTASGLCSHAGRQQSCVDLDGLEASRDHVIPKSMISVATALTRDKGRLRT